MVNELKLGSYYGTKQKKEDRIMKKLVEVTEVDGEGLESFLGQNITIYCLNYIYTGELEGVNDKFIKLKNPKIVYETGDHNSDSWGTAEPLKNSLYIMIQSIESFYDAGKK